MRWDPQQYARFADYRAKPFHDLLAAVRRDDVGTFADLGCGPGKKTALLLERWPDSRGIGVDEDGPMLARAAAHAGPRLRFDHGNIRSWQPESPVDLLFSNAALHWVGDHRWLIPRLAGHVAEAGTFAVQMPDNWSEPTHSTVREVARRGQWGEWVERIADRPWPVLAPEAYADLLTPLGFDVSAWVTVYEHPLDGPEDVLEWIRGSVLRPYFSALLDDQVAPFEAAVLAGLREAYPSGELTYRRVFFVATRAS